jgi:hypothetical protein
MSSHNKKQGHCEVFPGSDYTAEECAFLRAVDRYRIQHRFRFLAASDYLKILKALGYRKRRTRACPPRT